MKPNFSTLGSCKKISRHEPLFSYLPSDCKRNPLGIKAVTLCEEHNLSHNLVDIFLFENIFLGCDFAQGMIFRGTRYGIIHKYTMDVSPGCKYIEKFRGGVQGYMMENKDFVSSTNFTLKNENSELVSFNGQKALHSIIY